MQKNILVTGGTGFIGSHTVVTLIEAGYQVTIIDNLSNSNADIVDRIEKITGIRPGFEKLDLNDNELIKNFFAKKHDFDGIIHFAAYKAVGESVKEPLKYYGNNIGSLINLLQIALSYSITHFVFSSSCTVYGEPDELPVTEQTPVKKPSSPYGNTKKIAEEILQDVVKSTSLKAISLRYFNPTGAHPSALIGELPLGIPNNLIPIITQTAIGKREKVIVYGDDYPTPDGTCIRDYIHVLDLAKAHVKALERLAKQVNKENYEVFNVGTGKGNSVLEVIQTFEKVSGQKLNYEIGPRRDGDIIQIYADTNLANEVLGWKAVEPLESMLASAWKWEQYLAEQGQQWF